MPNHVTTRCIVTGPQPEIARLRALVFRVDNGNQIVDFNQVIPMPLSLCDSDASSTPQWAAQLLLIRGEALSFNTRGLPPIVVERIRTDVGIPEPAPMSDVAAAYLEKHPEEEAAGKRLLLNIVETGYPDWYEWSCANWGTKWNSYGFGIDESGDGFLNFHFDTAWSFPTLIFEMLATMFPTLRFACACCDECGNFAGRGAFNGEPVFEIGEATDELYELVYGEKPEWDDDAQDETDDSGSEETAGANPSDLASDLPDIEGDAAAGYLMQALGGHGVEITHDPDQDYIDDSGCAHRRLVFKRTK